MKYDKTLFVGAVDYYAEYRPKYPQDIFDRIAEVFELSKNDLFLDLGCGTGELALPLSKYLKEVMAWDPNAEMLELGRQKAKERDIENVLFEQKSSDDLPSLDGEIKLCTMGQSFHWMDGTSTLMELKKHLADGGGVAITGVRHGLHIYSSNFEEPNEITTKRNQIVSDVGMKYFGEERKAGRKVFVRDAESFGDMLDKAGFTEVEEVIFDTVAKRTIDDVMGFLFSTSWGNKNYLGDKADAFEEELRKKLLALKPDGAFEEKISFYMITAKVLKGRRV